MSNLFNITAINQEILIFLAIDVAVAIVLLTAMRFISGVSAKVNTKDELAKEDNFAFGISVAGSIAALGIVLSGAITGESAPSYQLEAIGMFAYGLFGLLLIKLGRFVHDKLALNKLNKMEQIRQRNITVGIVDAASVIATAIVIRAVLIWVDGLSIYTFVAIFSGFIVSQVMLVLVTRIRETHYARNNQHDSMQEAFVDGQIALALRYSGQIISTALAVTAASYFLIYSPETIIENLLGWLVFGMAMTVLVSLLTGFAKRIILFGINRFEEVDQQHNVGVAAIEMAISIAIAMILTGLMA
ncbi:DUF350 domain-containing protein [Thalassotalea sp. HSM 43]|uniref:DUF350 domain-containing protein n=1 Tax=Thalassotalea sp. HSM 43 TaxID=2552945 RepID=UPI00107FEE5C|nr:DUF350 domain-containing protein [Thalassotalea sp. HSM 43]QBY03695.1 DUF350 domain-containing protein [Thalassotalea sp. HSM 43]